MTPDHLARIAAAIERDADTEAANWPLVRDRTRAYLALARAVAAMFAEDAQFPTLPATPSILALRTALAALAPEQE